MIRKLTELECDVAVLGGGLAGTTLATRLQSQGLAVVCIEPHPERRVHVGESLDWSSPRLLKGVGFDSDRLVRERIGTYKRHVRVRPDGEPEFQLAPRPWFGWRPWRFELVTLHLDRERFDRECLMAARRAGVRFVEERVTRVRTEGDRVVAVETGGTLVRAHRYVDASGRARLLERALSIPVQRYGVPKVSLWTYLQNDGMGEGTTLTLDRGGYLQWLWEIPISPDVVSVGFTLPTDVLKARRRPGGVERLLREELERHEHFRGRIPEPLHVHTCAYQGYVHARTSGPNWLLVGESAAMVDPLTANGLTTALRFGAHAATLIVDSFDRPELPRGGRRAYDRCLRSMTSAFNRHIERVAYEPEMRARLGTELATVVYVLFGYFANAAYERIRPRGPLSRGVMRLVLGGFEAWFAAWSLVARLRAPRSRPAAVLAARAEDPDRPETEARADAPDAAPFAPPAPIGGESLRESLLADFRLEAMATRRVLAAVPADRFDWRPHERSMPLGALASHIAENPAWGLATLERDLDLAVALPQRRPFVATGVAELVAAFDANAAAFEQALEATDDCTLHAPWRLCEGERVLAVLPRHRALRVTLIHHQIHHRGQLSVYLRLLDVPVPRTYGPTADHAGFG